jgi:hypothetical protein
MGATIIGVISIMAPELVQPAHKPHWQSFSIKLLG